MNCCYLWAEQRIFANICTYFKETPIYFSTDVNRTETHIINKVAIIAHPDNYRLIEVMSTNKESYINNQLDFRSVFEKLEILISQMEDENMDLTEAMKAFKAGIKLTREAQLALLEVEQKVQLLIDNKDGIIPNSASADNSST